MLVKADSYGMFPVDKPLLDFSERLQDVVEDIIGELQNRFGEYEVGPPRAYLEVSNPDGSKKNIPYTTFAYYIVDPALEDFDALRENLISSVMLMTCGLLPSKCRLVWRLDEKVKGVIEYNRYKIRTRVAVIPGEA